MSEILAPNFIFPAITTIIAAIWGAYIYFEARPAKVREAERQRWLMRRQHGGN